MTAFRSAFQRAFPVIEVLWKARLDKFLATSHAFLLLVFPVEGYGDRVVTVVNFVTQAVQGGQGEGVDSIEVVRRRAAKLQPRTQVQEDIRSLVNDQVAML